MNPKLKTFLLFIIGASFGMAVMYFFKTYKIEKKQEVEQTKTHQPNNSFSPNSSKKSTEYVGSGEAIDQLTKEETVINYLKQNKELPPYYIRKGEARKQGWNPSRGNLCEVLPGRAIGGDVWTNRQKSLPTASGRKYFEADINYNCGNRNADRIVYSNDGLIFVTHDHYKTFDEK